MILHRAGISVLAASALVCAAAAAFAQVPSSRHVVLVIDENTAYNDVMANMPWLTSQGNTYGYATNYQSDNGGSLPDYLWLASGSCHSAAHCSLPAGTHDFNCNGNDCYYPVTATTDPITDDNIFRELNDGGSRWITSQRTTAAPPIQSTPVLRCRAANIASWSEHGIHRKLRRSNNQSQHPVVAGGDEELRPRRRQDSDDSNRVFRLLASREVGMAQN